MAIPLLELVRRLIRQDTVKVGGPVGNLYGTVRSDLGGLEQESGQTWALFEIPGTALPEWDQFLQAFLSSTGRLRLLVGVNGEVTTTAPPGVVQMLRGVVELRSSASFHLTADVGNTGGECAVYVDGTLIRRGRGVLSVPLTFSPGRHVVAVIAVSPRTVVTVPANIRIIGETDVPPVPVWESLTTGYLDEWTGTAANTLRWFGSPEAGGYRVLRRQPETLGDTVNDNGVVLTVGDPGGGSTFGVTIGGDHAATLSKGVELLADSSTIGIVVSAQPDDDGNTAVVCRLALGQTDVNPAWVGQAAAIGSFRELTRIALTAATPIVEYQDTAVVVGEPYEYALQAFGLVDELAVGALSEVRYIVAGDLEAPGPIVIHAGYPEVNRQVVTVRFTTPDDLDYEGVQVYFRRRVLNDQGVTSVPYQVAAISLDGLTITIDDPELDPDTLAGYTARFGTSPIGYTVDDNAAGTLTLASPVDAGVSVGDDIHLFFDTRVKTDFGLPDRDDALEFRALDYGQYYFATFDRSGNEQIDADAVFWEYTTADDTFDELTLGPLVAMRQLLPAEQAFFLGYEDPVRYSLIELYAYLADAPDTPVTAKFANIHLYYQRKADAAPIELYPIPNQLAAFPALVTGVPSAVLDNPFGTRSRYVALSRGADDSWIRIWAQDSVSELESDTLTFVVDYDNTPEITSLETEVNNSSNAVNWTAVADDDCNGVRWWVDPADAGEPTVGAPAQVDTRTLKSVSRSVLLQLGQRKTLYLRGYGDFVGSVAQGLEGALITRELVRTPRSFVTFDNKGADGNRSATAVTARFTVLPTPQTLVTGTGTGTATTWTDGSKSWTVDQYAASDLKHYYLKVTPAVVTEATPVVVRKIVSNTATQLVLRSGLPVSAQGSHSYQIVDGAVEVAVSTGSGSLGGTFVPTRGTETYSRSQETYLQFFGTKAGCLPENVRSVLIDPDTVPTLLSLDLQYDQVEEELVTSISGADDDAKYWRLYVRKGDWPTTVAGSALASPDPKFLRFTGSVSQTTVRQNVTSGIYYAVAIPTNSLGQDGPAITASLDVDPDDPTPPPSGLTELTASAAVGGTTAVVTYGHTSGAAGTVVIKGGRTDLVGGNLPVLTSGRNVTWETAGADTVPLQGAYAHSIGETVVSSGGLVREWKYTVELYNPTLVSSRTTTMQVRVSTVPPNSPGLSGVGVVIDNPGYCRPDGECVTPHSQAVYWTATDAPSATFEIAIERTAQPLGPNNWTLWASGINPADAQYIDYESCVSGTTNTNVGMLYTWQYRVYLRRRSDGVNVAGPVEVQVTNFCGRCWDLAHDGDET